MKKTIYFFLATVALLAAASCTKEPEHSDDPVPDPDPETPIAYNTPGAYLTGQERSYVAGTDQYCIEYDGTHLTFILLNPAQDEQVVISGYDTASHAVGDAVTIGVNWQKAGSSPVNTSLSMTIAKMEGEQVWMATSDDQWVVIRTE